MRAADGDVVVLPLRLVPLLVASILLAPTRVEARVGAQTDQADEHVDLRSKGPTSFVLVTPSLGHPLEREPEVVRASPSYRSAILRDAHARWREAIPLYQRAVTELASRYRVQPSERLEEAMAKVDLERERSASLARLQERSAAGTSARDDPPSGRAVRRAALAKGRLLRLKLMSVRAQTGRIAAPLLADAEAALRRAADERSDGANDDPNAGAEMREANLLLCATHAVSGDRRSAEAELARAGTAARHEPAHALSLAACLAALGRKEEALGALAAAVAVQTSRPAAWPSGESAPERDLHLANDWDPLRRDSRFESLFRP